MDAAIALLPLVLVVVLMIFARWSAAAAGLVGAVSALVVAVATATALGLPLVTMVAAQAFGAAVGNIICPHNIVAGSATVGLMGREGEVMKETLPACALYATLGGVLVFVLVSLSQP